MIIVRLVAAKHWRMRGGKNLGIRLKQPGLAWWVTKILATDSRHLATLETREWREESSPYTQQSPANRLPAPCEGWPDLADPILNTRGYGILCSVNKNMHQAASIFVENLIRYVVALSFGVSKTKPTSLIFSKQQLEEIMAQRSIHHRQSCTLEGFVDVIFMQLNHCLYPRQVQST